VIVVDASAAILGLLNDGHARRHLADEAFAVPHLADAEVAHVLRGHVLKGVLAAEDGRIALGRWSKLGMQRFAAVGLLDRIWELRANVSAYDATYVALAEELDCPLLTADARLAGAPGPRCSIIVVRR
jgi:predicted nucleic acid-binding protein